MKTIDLDSVNLSVINGLAQENTALRIEVLRLRHILDELVDETNDNDNESETE